MKLAILLLALSHLVVAFLVAASSVQRRHIFSLQPVLILSLLLYLTVPIVLCLPHHAVLINGALVPVSQWALLWAGIAGLGLAILIFLLPPPPTSIPKDEPTGWAVSLFVVLALANTWTLISFLRVFDADIALIAMLEGTGSTIRDLAYDTLLDADSGLGYVTKVLHIALFGWLWLTGRVNKLFLLAGVAPVVVLDVVSLGRHTIASFLVVLFFVIERSRGRGWLYVAAPAALGAIFFFRVILFSFTDWRYDSWTDSAFTASSEGVEALGEFFNTFGTYLMIASLPGARFGWEDILSMVASQAVLPPGTGGLWQWITQSGFPLFAISDLMKARYGPHPAHLSIADLYTFGGFALVGVIGYFATAVWAARGRTAEAVIVYVYLVGMFYLPFRGSLTLNAMRFVWLLVGLHLIAAFGRYLARRRSEPRSAGTLAVS